MQNHDDKGYPRFPFDINRQAFMPTLVTLALVVLAIASFFIYTHISTDLSPDSVAGYTYAIAGTVAMLLATFLYTRARNTHRSKIGQLNSALLWHIGLGVLALVLLLLHSFADFNPRSGTYALYGMIAIVISGAFGRMIDRLMPRLIAQEASKALTEDGEDRIEAISHTIQAIVSHNTENVQGFSITKPGKRERSVAKTADRTPGRALPESWDLAYISLAETPQETSRNAQQYRFVPDPKSPLPIRALLSLATPNIWESCSLHKRLCNANVSSGHSFAIGVSFTSSWSWSLLD